MCRERILPLQTYYTLCSGARVREGIIRIQISLWQNSPRYNEGWDVDEEHKRRRQSAGRSGGCHGGHGGMLTLKIVLPS